jgi:hypothetical protein
MQSNEQIILKNLRQLSPEKQQEVVNFTEHLRQKFFVPKLSLKQIAAMPLAERHRYLAQFISQTADDFITEPDLTEFSVLDTEDWEYD